MANFNNQIPSADLLREADKIILTESKSGTLPQGDYLIEAHGAAGGYSQWVRYVGSYSDAGSGSWRNDGGPSYRGGAAVAGRTNYSTQKSASIAVNIGRAGTNWNTGKANSYVDVGLSTGTFRGEDGGSGTDTTISFDGREILRCIGGGGGKAASITLDKALNPPAVTSRNHRVNMAGWDGEPGRLVGLNFSPIAAAGPQVIITVLKLNRGPSAPAFIRNNGAAYSGRMIELECGVSIDPEGDPIRYIWELRADDGAWSAALNAKGEAALTSETKASLRMINSGTRVQFRVKASDDKGSESAYTTGESCEIIYNYPPSISGEDEERGRIEAPFSYAFQLDDPDEEDRLFLRVSLGEEVLFELEGAERKKEYRADIAGVWPFLPPGKHSLLIEVRDDKGAAVQRRIAFEKYLRFLEVMTREPLSINGGEAIRNFIPILKLSAPHGSKIRALANNNWPSDRPEDWQDFGAALGDEQSDAQIFEFAQEGSGALMIHIKVEKAQDSTEEIVFSGITLLLNANGNDNINYARDVLLRPSELSAGGLLGQESNLLDALNALSLRAASKLRVLGDYSIDPADWHLNESTGYYECFVLHSSVGAFDKAYMEYLYDAENNYRLEGFVYLRVSEKGKLCLSTSVEPEESIAVQFQTMAAERAEGE